MTGKKPLRRCVNVQSYIVPVATSPIHTCKLQASANRKQQRKLISLQSHFKLHRLSWPSLTQDSLDTGARMGRMILRTVGSGVEEQVSSCCRCTVSEWIGHEQERMADHCHTIPFIFKLFCTFSRSFCIDY